MAEKLTFSGMTWDILEDNYGIDLRDRVLFEDYSLVEPTPTLVENIRRGLSFRLANERARAHRLVDPVLAELEMSYKGKINTIPEMYLEVKDVEGLSGNPDFILSAGTTKNVVPIVAIVEAKNLDGGAPQCAAELYAAYLLDKGALKRLYGCVTTGTDWRFLSFDGDAKQVVVDPTTYLVSQLPRLLGIFQYIIDGSLAALEHRHKE